jgi:hypothetical protein
MSFTFISFEACYFFNHFSCLNEIWSRCNTTVNNRHPFDIQDKFIEKYRVDDDATQTPQNHECTATLDIRITFRSTDLWGIGVTCLWNTQSILTTYVEAT